VGCGSVRYGLVLSGLVRCVVVRFGKENGEVQ